MPAPALTDPCSLQVNTNSNADARAKPAAVAAHTFGRGQGPHGTSHAQNSEQHHLRNVAIGGQAGIPHRSDPASTSAVPGQREDPQEMKRVLQESIATLKEQLRHQKAADEDDSPAEPPHAPQQPHAALQPALGGTTQASLLSRARKTRLLPAARLSAPGEGPRWGTAPTAPVLAAQGGDARAPSPAGGMAAGGREEAAAQSRAARGALERRRASSHYSSSDEEEDERQIRCVFTLCLNHELQTPNSKL